jgi:hypothetical protein
MSLSKSRALAVGAILLAVGTLAFRLTEGLSLIDSFYLSAMTFTTVGFGDMHPVTRPGKLSMQVFSLLAIGYFSSVLLPLCGELVGDLTRLFGFKNKVLAGLTLLFVNGLVCMAVCGAVQDPGLPSVDNWFDCFYFSFVVGSSVGYGDITPKTPRGKLGVVLYSLLAMHATGTVIGQAGDCLRGLVSEPPQPPPSGRKMTNTDEEGTVTVTKRGATSEQPTEGSTSKKDD